MDKAHAVMLKVGLHRCLFGCVGEREQHRGEFTRMYWRMIEDREMILLPATMNTQGQSAKGMNVIETVW